MQYKIFKTSLAAFSIAMLTLVTGCHHSAGIKKDLNTGLSSTYKNLEPEKVYLLMNNSVLNNNDIPLGEKFLVINENVEGFKEKEGKISIGCSLKLSDQKGKVLLDEKDLFIGKDLFKPEDAAVLRCTVTTGNPMEAGEKYNIDVIFWDKLGDGKIENKLTIRAIE